MNKTTFENNENASKEVLVILTGADGTSEIDADIAAVQIIAEAGEEAAKSDQFAADGIAAEGIEAANNNVSKSGSIANGEAAEDKSIKETAKLAGKFKNPEELARAYGELEKEFTKRSQKLAALETEMQKKSASYEPTDEEWRETVDKFFDETPAARPFAKDIAKELITHPELKSDAACLSAALTRVLVAKFRTPEQMLADGQFLNDYVLSSDTVKAAVIEGYLKDLKSGKPPVVLSDRGQVGLAPKSKPKSIEEAGQLFLKNNK